MGLLKRKSENPVDAIAHEFNDLLVHREVLENRLEQARTALAASLDERRAALLDADLDDATAAARRDAAVRDAKDQHEAIADALAQLGAKITDTEARLAAARDAAARKEVALAVNAEADTLAAAIAAFADAGAKLIPVAEAVAARMPGVAGDFVPRIRQLINETAILDDDDARPESQLQREADAMREMMAGGS